jgi:hypothetical protein
VGNLATSTLVMPELKGGIRQVGTMQFMLSHRTGV